MTSDQVFITKTHTHYRDLKPGPLVSLSGPQSTKTVGRQICTNIIKLRSLFV
jgi:hypothetical protein